MTIDTAYTKIERRVKMFKALSASARKAINEDNTRKDFILPLFHALDWETDNSAEVSAEEKVSRGFVDFAFRLNGVPRFFLETKRVSEDLTKPEWVRQTVDYAWTKGVTWALLSNFESLRVFNAEWRESNPLHAQFIEFDVDSYLTDFERLWWLSKPESAHNRLDREAEKVGKKTKRLPVSQHLFDDLKTWRQDLFHNMRQNEVNAKWSSGQIDEAILRILNRLIFIRTAEDRQVEPGRLHALVRELNARQRGRDLLPELRKLFREMNTVYDSELFAPHAADAVDCWPTPLEGLIEGLYGSAYFQYNFNAIDADVLGAAYEQYLGHIVTDPERSRRAAEVVEKRAKRKSQGIFYTPTFVVKYIVQQTVGKYLAEQGYSESHPPRILDMACGSGSFLIEAFDVLDRYVAAQRRQQHGQHDVLDHARQVEVLQQCLFGVDKDKQAVDVARLNLMLKALNAREGLPKLQNIVHSDSLRMNWQQEFSEVMEDGGFDIIIGNPPYVRPQNLPIETKEFLWEHFSTFVAKSDLYCCFMQQAIDLAKPGGLISFVVSDGWLRLDSFQAIRKYILSKCRILELIDLPDKVFEDATVKTGIFVLQKKLTDEKRASNQLRVLSLSLNSVTPELLRKIPQSAFKNTPRNVFDLSLSLEMRSFKQSMESEHPKLADLVDIRFGLKTGDDEKFIHESAKTKRHKPLLRGENIHRYKTEFAGEYVWYVPEKMREHRKTARPGDKERFEQPKVLVRDTGQWFECTLDQDNYYVKDVLILTGAVNNRYSLHYITGLLNSKAMRFYYETTFPTLHVQNSELAVLPIRRINFDDRADKRRHDRLVALVEEMLQLQTDHAEADRNLDDQRHTLQRRIQQVDNKIDALVYQLYGLTEDEIKIVEGR